MKNKKEKETFFSIMFRASIIGFATYGVYKLLESFEEKDKDKVKIKEVFEVTQEGSIIKKFHSKIYEYSYNKIGRLKQNNFWLK